MAGNTNNNIELLVGIRANTAESKNNIQEDLNALSKQLTGLDVKINVDKESKKVLDDLSKLDLSKLKTQVEDLNSSLGKIGQGLGEGVGKGAKKAGEEVSNAARVAEKTWKSSMDEVSKAVGVDLDKVIKKGYTSVDEIKKAFSTIDGSVKLDFDVSQGTQKLEKFKAQIERDGITQSIDFKLVGIQDGDTTLNAWMPNMVKEVDRSVQAAAQSITKLDSELQKARNSGKITEDQYKKLNRELRDLAFDFDTKEFGVVERSVERIDQSLQRTIQTQKQQVDEEKKETAELKEQERLRKQLHKLEVDMISVGKSRPKVNNLKEYQDINKELERMGKYSTLHADEVTKVQRQYDILNAQTKEVGRTQIGIVDSFKIAMEKFPIWMAASTAFYGAVRTAKEFFDIIVDIDTKMTDLRKVMSDDTDFSAVFDRATESAERFGQTISQTLDAYTEFARQGFTGAELGYLADAAVAAGNVADLETGKAAEYMTASLIQWKMEAENAMGVIDSWNEISNNYATTVENIAQGQARAGATARAMGLDFDQTNALVATLTASTKQSGNEIGNFVKSVLPRLLSRPAQNAMESLGVNLTDGQGNLRDIIDVYTEIANKMQDISEAERIEVAEALGGKYHISRIQTLLDDLGSVDSMYRQIHDSSVNSAGSAMEENEAYMESLEARMNLARVEVEKLALAIGDAFLTEGIIQFIAAFSEFLRMATAVVDRVGALPMIFGTLAASVYMLSGRFRGLVGAIAQGVTGLLGFTTATRTADTATKSAAVSTTAFSTALRGLLAATGVGIVLAGVGIAVEKLVGNMAREREIREEVASQMKVATEEYKQNADSIHTLSERYSELESQINSGNFTPEGFREYKDIGNELAQILPQLKVGEDAHGDAILGSSSAVEAKVQNLERQLEIQEQIAAFEQREKAEENLEVAEKDFEKFSKQMEMWERILFKQEAGKSNALDALGIDADAIRSAESLNIVLDGLIARREELNNKVGTTPQDEVDLVNLEQAIADLTDIQFRYQEVEASHNYAVNNMTQANDSLMNSILGTNRAIAASTRGTFNEISAHLSILDADSGTINTVFAEIRKDAENNGPILKAVDEYAGAMDTLKEKQAEGLDSAQLADYRNQALESLRDLKREFNEFGSEMGLTGEQMDGLDTMFDNMQNSTVGFGISMDDIAAATGMSRQEVESMLLTVEGGAEVLDSLSGSTENATGKTYELVDAIDMLSGVSQQQIEDADTLLWQYENLSAQLATLDEGTREYAETEAMLNGVKGQLLDLYPHLFDAQTTAENLTYDQIEAIQQEILAQDTLRAAIKASRDGKLTAEQNQTLASWQGTRARINNINEEIRALSILAQHYNSIQSGMAAARAAATAFAPGAFGTVMNAGFTAQMKQFEYLNTRYETATANLQKDLALEKSYIDTMRTSQEVLDRGTSRANKNAAAQKKASDKASKAKKDNAKASKEQQKAIEETNETIREAIYLADTYAEALDRLALAIKKEQDQRSKFSEHSKQYRESIMREIELQKEQLNVMQQQEQAYKNQIAKGVVIKRGEIVTTEYQKTTSTAPARTVKPSGFGGRITSGYGYRTHPVTGQRGSFHAGIDVASPKGTRLDSPVDGRVTSAVRNHATLGNYVVVTDSSGMKHMMGHLNSIAVKVGQQIMAGMQVGAIGETGRATGPHLHYEVRNSANKAVNPTPYLNRARAGVKSGGGQVTVVNPVQKKSVTEEIAQSEQDVANLKSELLGLQGEMVDIAALIRQLEIDMVTSQLAEFDAKRQQYQQTIDYEQEKIKGLDVTSERYLKTLDIYIREMNNKQRVNKQELDYLNRMINSGQLTAATTDELKVRVRDLTTEMMALNNEIQQVSFDKITTSMRKFEEALSEIEYQLSLSEGKLSAFEEGTGDYNKELANQISLMKQRSDEIMRQRYALERLILSENINIEQIKELKQQIHALNLEYWSLQGSIKSTEEALADAQKKLANEVADRLIESYKQVIQQRQEAHMRALDREMDAEDKRHKQVMDNYKKELDSFNKIIQAKLDEIDREESERDYNKEIDELEKDRRELTDQLNLLKLDDSFEAKAQRRDLQEQISQIDETIAEKRHDREVELRKEALNEMLEDKREEISEQEKAETERHEAERDRIDKQREYWNQYYNDLANDERKFAQIREQILEGNFDAIEGMFKEMLQEMIDTMPELENTMDGTMEAVGTSIRQNIIDNLREALQLLSELGGKQAVGSNPQTKLLSTADMQVLAGKFITENLAEQFDDDLARQANVRKKGYDLAAQGRAAGSTIPKDVGYDAYLSRLTPEQQEQLRQFIGAQSGMYLTPKYNEALENYGKGQRFSAADYKVLTGKFLVDKATGAAKNASERNVILNRGRTWGQQGRAQGSKLDQYASFDQLINSMDNQELTEFANYLQSQNLFSEYYLKSFVEDYVKRILATATQFETGGYTGSWNKSGGKLAILHEKELVLNQAQTQDILGAAQIMEKIRNMMPSVPNMPQSALSRADGGNTYEINFNIEKMNGDQNDVRSFSKMFSDEMKRIKGWK